MDKKKWADYSRFRDEGVVMWSTFDFNVKDKDRQSLDADEICRDGEGEELEMWGLEDGYLSPNVREA